MLVRSGSILSLLPNLLIMSRGFEKDLPLVSLIKLSLFCWKNSFAAAEPDGPVMTFEDLETCPTLISLMMYLV